MSTEDKVRLRHMLDGALEATAFSSTKHRKDLDGDRKLVLALVKDLEIVGEAAANVSRETQLRHTDIPWSDIIGMRHRLTHAYFDIDLDVVWQTIKGDLPPLIRALRNSLEGDANGVDR